MGSTYPFGAILVIPSKRTTVYNGIVRRGAGVLNMTSMPRFYNGVFTMNNGGGVYGYNVPPICSTMTALFPYQAENVAMELFAYNTSTTTTGAFYGKAYMTLVAPKTNALSN